MTLDPSGTRVIPKQALKESKVLYKVLHKVLHKVLYKVLYKVLQEITLWLNLSYHKQTPNMLDYILRDTNILLF